MIIARFGSSIAAFLIAVIFLAGTAFAQGLTPMKREGVTAGPAKAFYVAVRNPYDRPMSFSITPVETDFETLASRAKARPHRVRLGAQKTRRVILLFEIPQNAKERTIALCVQPEEPLGSVVTRVCGTYTARRVGG